MFKTLGFIVGVTVTTVVAISVGVVLANTYLDEKQKQKLKEQELKKDLDVAVAENAKLNKTIEDKQEELEKIAEQLFAFEDHYTEVVDAITTATESIKSFVEMEMFTETPQLARKVKEVKNSIKSLNDVLISINKEMPLQTYEDQHQQGIT